MEDRLMSPAATLAGIGRATPAAERDVEAALENEDQGNDFGRRFCDGFLAMLVLIFGVYLGVTALWAFGGWGLLLAEAFTIIFWGAAEAFLLHECYKTYVKRRRS